MTLPAKHNYTRYFRAILKNQAQFYFMGLNGERLFEESELLYLRLPFSEADTS